MDSLARKWNCSHCGRRNRSAVGGKSMCSYCGRVTVVHGAMVPYAGRSEEGAEVLAVRSPEAEVRS